MQWDGYYINVSSVVRGERNTAYCRKNGKNIYFWAKDGLLWFRFVDVILIFKNTRSKYSHKV